jgi:uncharacterized repeat protein (TIGR03987 family)
MLPLAIVLITLALLFYSIGVWSERLARYLKGWHVVVFWTGFLLDLGGTIAMHLLAAGPFDLTKPHTLTGQIALWLMLVHAAWATAVVRRGTTGARASFHRYSLFVWLVPYVGGMVLAMGRPPAAPG